MRGTSFVRITPPVAPVASVAALSTTGQERLRIVGRGERLTDDVDAARHVEVVHAAAAAGPHQLRGAEGGKQRGERRPQHARGDLRNRGREAKGARPFRRQRDDGRDVSVGGRRSPGPPANAVDDVCDPDAVRRASALRSTGRRVGSTPATTDPEPARRGGHRESLNNRAPVDRSDDRARPERERDVRVVSREPAERARVVARRTRPGPAGRA